MSRGEEFRALDVAVAVVGVLNLDIHMVDGVVSANTRLNGYGAKLIGQHCVCRMNLTTIEEWGVEVVTIEEGLLVVVPLTEGVVAMLAI